MVVANNKINGDNKNMSNTDNFDGHADTAVQCGTESMILLALPAGVTRKHTGTAHQWCVLCLKIANK
jgi:hypothetical protein